MRIPWAPVGAAHHTMCCIECENDYDIVYYTDATIWAHPYLCPDCGGGMVKIINLTPHAVNLHVKITSKVDAIVVIPSSGTVARCVVERQQVTTVAGIPVNRTVFGAVEGLPEPKEGVYYIVSSIVAQACPERHDLLIVDDTVRDEQGRIVGCRALATVHGLEAR